MRTLLALGLLALLARADRVAVRVVIGDKPAEGVGLVVLKPDSELVFDRNTWTPKLHTDKAGQAVLDVPSGARIVAYLAGFSVTVVQPGGAVVDLSLKPERIVSGRLLDRKGDPIRNASVSVFTSTRLAAEFPAKTDKEGRFFAFGLWLDDYSLRANAPGFMELQTTFKTHDVTARMDRAARLAGRVVDGDGRPIAGVTILLDGEDRGRSGADGRFRTPELKPGRYELGVAPPYGLHATHVDLADGEQRRGFVVGILEPATLAVRVVDEKNRPRAGVLLQSRELLEADVVTDKEGRAVLRVTPWRRGVLTIHERNHVTQSIELGPEPQAGKRDLGTVALRPVPKVSVLIRTPDGKPAKGTIDKQPLKEGRITLAEGEYTVTSPGFAPQRFRVTAPGPVEVLLLVPRWLEGVVRGPDDKPAKALVHVNSQPFFTNAAGRFRAGPFNTATVRVSATDGRRSTPSQLVTISEGLLELKLETVTTEIIRGRVLRGGKPVERFMLNGRPELSEDGRFEVVVDRSVVRAIEIGIDGRIHARPLPAAGEELVIRIPDKVVRVSLAGGGPRTSVTLETAAGNHIHHRLPDENGLALFENLADGLYVADAAGYRPGQVRAGQAVVLARAPVGSVEFLLPRDLKSNDGGQRVLEAGVHKDVAWAEGPAQRFVVPQRLVVRRVLVRDGEQRRVDLRGGGQVVLIGEPFADVRLYGERDDLAFEYQAQLDERGHWRRSVPPGPYTLRVGARSLPLVVDANLVLEIRLARGAFAFIGRVLLADGRPAQGAVVRIDGALDEFQVFVTDLRGIFRVTGLTAGRYDFDASLRGYAPSRGTVVLGGDGRRSETGFPITLAKSIRARLQIQGMGAQPLRRVRVSVDGRPCETDTLGFVTLDRLPARIDIELEGYASVRSRVVREAGVLQLQRGAHILVRFDPSAGPVEVRIGGALWQPRPGWLPSTPGQLVLEDLPPGPVEVRQGPQEGTEEPDIVQSRLTAGERLTVDLRDG